MVHIIGIINNLSMNFNLCTLYRFLSVKKHYNLKRFIFLSNPTETVFILLRNILNIIKVNLST